jgi:hypothetical protein
MSEALAGHVRVFIEYLNDPEDGPMMFDVKMDPTGRKVLGSWPIFGCYGLYGRSEEIYPVILRGDGVLDFGFSEPNRFWRTDLRDRQLRASEYVVVWDHNQDEWAYHIRKVVVLGEREL